MTQTLHPPSDPETPLLPGETDTSIEVSQESSPEFVPLPSPPPQRRRWIWGGLGLLLLAGAGIGTWYFLRPLPLNVIPLSGRIEGYETDVSTKSTGRVEKVMVREGAVVKKGQLLVRLDDAEIRSELQAATAQVEAAQTKAAEAQIQIAVLQKQIDGAGLELQQAQGDSQGKIAEAQGLVETAQALVQQSQAQVEEVKAVLEQSRVDRDRYATLAKVGAIDRQRADLARTTYDTAAATLKSRQVAVEAARRAVEVAKGKQIQAQTTHLNPNRQQNQIASLHDRLAQTRAFLATAQANVRTAIATRNLMQSRLNNLTVLSPIDGVVTVRNVEPGTVVLPTRPLLRVVDFNNVYLRGFIPESELGRIRVGQAAKVFLDNDPNHKQPLNARITAIDAKASFTPENIYFQRDRVQQVFGVKLSIDRPGGLAKPGMPADANILL
ncbi:MAG: HlyD family efflux transporter periplasmic adaptor subunit [Thermosynechococcaceae cyanobacterium]